MGIHDLAMEIRSKRVDAVPISVLRDSYIEDHPEFRHRRRMSRPLMAMIEAALLADNVLIWPGAPATLNAKQDVYLVSKKSSLGRVHMIGTTMPANKALAEQLADLGFGQRRTTVS
ncbi:hypothetical protein ACWEPN_07070 [Nonomuraea wenchangensis]